MNSVTTIAEAHMHALRSTLAAAATVLCTLPACGDPAEPGPVVDELYLAVYTSEQEWNLPLMLIGEIGQADASAFRNSIGVDPGKVVFTSSNPSIVAVRSTGPKTAELVAARPGTVTIRASAGGAEDAREVRVETTLLPVDELYVRLAMVSEADADYETDGRHDRLIRVRLSRGESVTLDLMVLRQGVVVGGIPVRMTSSNPTVARIDVPCRPRELDPDCSIISDAGWITRVGAGTSVVTVAVRNLSATFEVIGLPSIAGAGLEPATPAL